MDGFRQINSFFLLFIAPFLGSGPKGVDDLCFHTYGEFFLLLLLLLLLCTPPLPLASRPISQPGGWGEGRGTKEEEEMKEKEEKIPHICESIGHRPLWGRCPKREEGQETSVN